jgi:DNA repair exonuclease SbcCD ATPase subunit
MTPGSTKLILSLMTIALGASLLKVRELSHDYDQAQQQNQDTQARIQILEAQLLKEHNKEQTALMSQQSLLEQLQQKIKDQKDVVQAAEDRLRQLQSVGSAGSQVPSIRDKMKTERAVIDDLEAKLKETRDHESGLKNQDHLYQQQAGITEKAGDEQLRAQINEQEQVLKQMNEDMKKLRRYNPYDPMGRNIEVPELQAKIDVQKTTIQQLKDQLSQNTVQWSYQKAQTRSQNQQDLSDLKTTEDQLSAQLTREKAAYDSMQKDVQNGVQSQKSQQTLIQSAQTDLQNQKTKLNDLQSQLEAEQNRLKDLASP